MPCIGLAPLLLLLLSSTNPSLGKREARVDHAEPRSAFLRRGVVQTRTMSRADRSRELLQTEGSGGNELQLFLVGLAHPGQGEELSSILHALSEDAFVYAYIPDDHYIIIATFEQVLALQDVLGITSSPFPDSHKIAPELDSVIEAAAAVVHAQQSQADDSDDGVVAPDGVSSAASAAAPSSGTLRISGGEADEGWVAEASRLDSCNKLWQLDVGEVEGPVRKLRSRRAQQKGRKKGGQEKKAGRSVMKAEDQAVLQIKEAVRSDGSIGDGSLCLRLLVLLATEVPSVGEQLASSWQENLIALTKDPGVSAKATAPGLVLVKAKPKDLSAVTQWLSKQALAVWVQAHEVSKANNMYASALMQRGAVERASDKMDPREMKHHPYWEVGLNGTGQVVSVVDTGASLGSCYLHDPDEEFVSKWKVDDDGVTYWTSSTHRKIVQYYGWMSMYDEGGHGTHVSTTVVGSLYSPDGHGYGIEDGEVYEHLKATGMAPGAKLAMFDVSNEELQQSMDGNDLEIPTEKGTYVYSINYESGARIQSNSWGEAGGAYTLTSMFLDKFLWHHPDTLNLQAVGNKGVDAMNKDTKVGTVTSPANSKNVLSVGATESWTNTALPRSLVALDMSVYAQVGRVGYRKTASLKNVFVPEWPIAGSVKDLEGLNLQVVLADPIMACSELLNGESLRGKAALFSRGSCLFDVKAEALLPAEPSLGMMMNSEAHELDAASMIITKPERKTIPIITLPVDVSAMLLSYLQQGNMVLVNISAYSDMSNQRAYDQIAHFSSFGPTTDGRLKPDVVAPGTLNSAHPKYVNGSPELSLNYDQCQDTEILQGTSMSTPVVAGAAAIIRQYFEDGFLGEGTRESSTKLSPSGILIKALLVAGAANMEGYSYGSRRKLEPAPSMFQGFGRIDLSRTLPLENDELGWKLQVADMVIIKSQQTITYIVECTGDGPLSVVLTWYDYWSFPGAGGKLLINNLDLFVSGPSQFGDPNRRSTWAGNMGPEPQEDSESPKTDVINTVERVYIEEAAAGQYFIQVSASVLPAKAISQPNQYFSLAAVGGLKSSGYLVVVSV